MISEYKSQVEDFVAAATPLSELFHSVSKKNGCYIRAGNYWMSMIGRANPLPHQSASEDRVRVLFF